MADTDLGLGVGAIASLSRFGRGYSPFRWQLQALAFVTMKSTEEGIQTVFHDDWIKLDLPGLFDGRLRLMSSVGFSRHSNTGYYGLGNAATAQPDVDQRRYQYDRVYPQALIRARIKLGERLGLMLGGSFTYNLISLYEGSKLAEDLQGDDAQLRDRLRGTDGHAMVVLNAGLLWDSRNHDLVPSRGVFHEASIRFTPDPRSDLSHAGATLALRFYRSLYRDRLVFAARVMADLLLGDPPIYELARHGGLFPMPAPGGGAGIRGVPIQRYHGKIKLLSNFELRARILPFTVFNQRFNIGAIAFVDAGRVWAGYKPSQRLDGDGLGLKVGAGGGLRVQWGEAFLLRADVAWSPDADPVGFYFNANHVF
jgi:outer membrane protein assembly factor BamA